MSPRTREHPISPAGLWGPRGRPRPQREFTHRQLTQDHNKRDCLHLLDNLFFVYKYVLLIQFMHITYSIYAHYLFSANATLTAQATVQPTIGLLPMPRKPIISTCAGTEEEPAN